MSRLRLLDPAGTEPVTDGTEEISRAELRARVDAVAALIAEKGLGAARLVIPLDAGLGALAALIAAIETRANAALVMRGANVDAMTWPAFCDAALVPPKSGAPEEGFRIIPLSPGAMPDGLATGEGRIWLHSSGTTGAPKWILHDSATFLENARACLDRLDLTPADRVMIPVSIHHAFGLGAGLLPSLMAGASIRLVPPGNPLASFQAQRSFNPSVIFMAPSQVRSILALGRKAGMARLVVTAGDRLQPDEAALFEPEHGPLISLYGSSEMGVISAGKPDDPADLRHRTAGAPLHGVTLALSGDVAPGDDGSVPMRIVHQNGFLGYADPETGALRDPAPDHWKTGDLVVLHDGPDGTLRIEVMGRADFAVNRDGLLVHLGQIEGCLSRAPGVAVAGVATAGRIRRGVGLIAFCALTKPGITSKEELLSHCRAALPPRAVPDHLEILPNVPLLPTGKVDRQALATLAHDIAENGLGR